jgi:hypothetical protein
MSQVGGIVAPFLKVGPAVSGDGTTPQARGGQQGETVVKQATGKYSETVERGNVYTACGAVGGAAVQTSITSTVGFALFNPAGSGVKLRILRVSLAYISGTLGAGAFMHAAYDNQGSTALSGGTAAVIRNCQIGNTAVDATTKASDTAVLGAAPTQLRPFGSAFAELATTANGMQTVTEDVDGEFVVMPGGVYSITSIMGAAGTSPKVITGVTYERVPLVG